MTMVSCARGYQPELPNSLVRELTPVYGGTGRELHLLSDGNLACWASKIAATDIALIGNRYGTDLWLAGAYKAQAYRIGSTDYICNYMGSEAGYAAGVYLFNLNTGARIGAVVQEYTSMYPVYSAIAGLFIFGSDWIVQRDPATFAAIRSYNMSKVSPVASAYTTVVDGSQMLTSDSGNYPDLMYLSALTLNASTAPTALFSISFIQDPILGYTSYLNLKACTVLHTDDSEYTNYVLFSQSGTVPGKSHCVAAFDNAGNFIKAVKLNHYSDDVFPNYVGPKSGAVVAIDEDRIFVAVPEMHGTDYNTCKLHIYIFSKQLGEVRLYRVIVPYQTGNFSSPPTTSAPVRLRAAVYSDAQKSVYLLMEVPFRLTVGGTSQFTGQHIMKLSLLDETIILPGKHFYSPWTIGFSIQPSQDFSAVSEITGLQVTQLAVPTFSVGAKTLAVPSNLFSLDNEGAAQTALYTKLPPS